MRIDGISSPPSRAAPFFAAEPHGFGVMMTGTCWNMAEAHPESDVVVDLVADRRNSTFWHDSHAAEDGEEPFQPDSFVALGMFGRFAAVSVPAPTTGPTDNAREGESEDRAQRAITAAPRPERDMSIPNQSLGLRWDPSPGTITEFAMPPVHRGFDVFAAGEIHPTTEACVTSPNLEAAPEPHRLGEAHDLFRVVQRRTPETADQGVFLRLVNNAQGAVLSVAISGLPLEGGELRELRRRLATVMGERGLSLDKMLVNGEDRTRVELGGKGPKSWR